MWWTNRLLWHTNSDFYGIRTPHFMPYEPFLLGVGVVFNLLTLGASLFGIILCTVTYLIYYDIACWDLFGALSRHQLWLAVGMPTATSSVEALTFPWCAAFVWKPSATLRGQGAILFICRGRVNREVQTVNWEANKKGAVETGVKSGL